MGEIDLLSSRTSRGRLGCWGLLVGGSRATCRGRGAGGGHLKREGKGEGKGDLSLPPTSSL